MSVVIPTYDRVDTLQAAVASVLDSSGGVSDIEVIVGDDGDRGPAVLGKWAADGRVTYVGNPARLGMSANWNQLLDRARGQFLGLLMDDDRHLPGFLHACLAAFANDSELGVVFTNHCFDVGGTFNIRHCPLQPGRHDSFLRALLEVTPIAVSAAVMRREAWDQARPLPRTAAADMVLYARIAQAGWPFHYIDEPLMAYRIHADQLSGAPRFCEDAVMAWESIVTDDDIAERLRCRRLADALMGRAALRLRENEWSACHADVRRALSLGPSSRRRALALSMATGSPLIGRLSAALLRHRDRLRGALRAGY